MGRSRSRSRSSPKRKNRRRRKCQARSSHSRSQSEKGSDSRKRSTRSPSRRRRRARSDSQSGSRGRRRSSSRVRQRAASRSRAASGERNGEFSGEAPSRIFIAHSACGKIIGRKGETRIDIERESEASLKIQREEEMDAGAKERWVDINGNSQQRHIAIQRIMALVNFVRDDSGKVLKDGAAAAPSSAEVSGGRDGKALILQISCNEVGQIIGRGGEVITRLEHESRARIEVDKGEGQITVSGRADAISRARELILGEVSFCTLPDGTVLKDNARPVGRPPLPIGKEGPVKIWVLGPDAGKVIGRGGETVREIMQSTGAEIQVERTENNQGQAERLIQILGTPSQIREAVPLVIKDVTFARGELGILKSAEMGQSDIEDALKNRISIGGAPSFAMPPLPRLSNPFALPGMPPMGRMPGMPGMMPPGMMLPPGMPPQSMPGMMMPFGTMPGAAPPGMPPMDMRQFGGPPGMFPGMAFGMHPGIPRNADEGGASKKASKKKRRSRSRSSSSSSSSSNSSKGKKKKEGKPPPEMSTGMFPGGQMPPGGMFPGGMPPPGFPGHMPPAHMHYFTTNHGGAAGMSRNAQTPHVAAAAPIDFDDL